MIGYNGKGKGQKCGKYSLSIGSYYAVYEPSGGSADLILTQEALTLYRAATPTPRGGDQRSFYICLVTNSLRKIKKRA